MNILHLITNVQYCYDYTVDNQISIGLLLYAHLPAAIISILFAIFLLYKTRAIQSITLSIVCIAFAIWTFLSLSTWFSFLGSANTMFTWSLIDLFGLIFFFFSYYFLYTFIQGRDLPAWQKITGVCLIIPTSIWTFLGSNLSAYNANYCEAVENSSVTNYPYMVQAFVILAVIVLVIVSIFRTKERNRQKKIFLAGLGVFIFLLFFLSSTFGASLLVDYNIWQYAYNIEIYGLFGMPILLVFLGFLIVRYKAFNIKLIGTQALVLGLIVLIGSQFAFIQTNTNRILTAITLIITGGIGINLIRSVKKEVAQREHIEKLAGELQKANEKLKELDHQKTEFLSFASHQLRSPVTAIKGYSSMILEGSFGEVTGGVKKAVDVVFQSACKLVMVIEDFLDISRIELGRMKYDFAEADLRELVQNAVKPMQPIVESRQLSLTVEIDSTKDYHAKIDAGKIAQVLGNLIDNAIKYTAQGSITVRLARLAQAIRIEIKDTGAGIDKETMAKLFQKFSRAANASHLNMTGTGLGLFVARQLVEAHHGKLWAESAGKDQGSTFIVELPIG